MDIAELLKYAISKGASDLHLLPGLAPMVRIHGELSAIPNLSPLSASESHQLLVAILSPEQKSQLEKQHELDFALNLPDLGNFRVSALRQIHGFSAVIRIIPQQVPTFEQLELPSVLKTLLLLPHGLILITGPTGSGKSTTLAAMVEYLNTIRACHIITIEDPIEFIYQSKKSLINQRQVGRDTNDAATALRAALRQDPDVILLGEMRDLETIRLALTAAETGHLVMGTLHASSAPLAISRIIDSFPAEEKNRVRNLLSESVQAVICQTLVKRMQGGRVGAFEVMLATPAIRHLIREDKIAHMVMTIQTNGDIGMCSMDQFLQTLVMKNIISAATARAAAANQDWFHL